MSDMKRVNPELVKAAAELAFHGKGWFIHRVYYSSASDFKDRIEYVTDEKEGEFEDFDPLHSDSDAWALERALKREGFCFGSWPDGRAWAENRRMMIERMDDPSDTLLLLKCVSAMTSLPLYAEESMG